MNEVEADLYMLVIRQTGRSDRCRRFRNPWGAVKFAPLPLRLNSYCQLTFTVGKLIGRLIKMLTRGGTAGDLRFLLETSIICKYKPIS